MVTSHHVIGIPREVSELDANGSGSTSVKSLDQGVYYAITCWSVVNIDSPLLLLQLWDIRKKAAIQTFQNTYQVLAVTFNDTSDQIISGGIDNDIKVCLVFMLHFPFAVFTHRGESFLTSEIVVACT